MEVDKIETEKSTGDFIKQKERLLRLRKDVGPDKVSVESSQEFFETKIKDTFDEKDLVAQELVEIPTDLVDALNEKLVAIENTGDRPQERHGKYLDKDASLGLLIDDMSTRQGRFYSVQFKPKWLVQAPNAPHHSLRCRNCALRALRSQTGTTWSRPMKKKAWCPLSLIKDSRSEVKRTVDAILSHQAFYLQLEPTEKLAIEEKFISYIMSDGRDLLRHLADTQQKLDPHGVICELKKKETSADLPAAMTLRDCTIYVLFSVHDYSLIRACIGDLDGRQLTESKKQHWLETEKTLREGGYYIGEENPPLPEQTCLLTLNFPDFPYYV